MYHKNVLPSAGAVGCDFTEGHGTAGAVLVRRLPHAAWELLSLLRLCVFVPLGPLGPGAVALHHAVQKHVQKGQAEDVSGRGRLVKVEHNQGQNSL